MAYIQSSTFGRVKEAIRIAEDSTQEELLVLARRHATQAFEITEVLNRALVIAEGIVYLELEYEYFTVEDRCLTNVVQIKLQ